MLSALRCLPEASQRRRWSSWPGSWAALQSQGTLHDVTATLANALSGRHLANLAKTLKELPKRKRDSQEALWLMPATHEANPDAGDAGERCASPVALKCDTWARRAWRGGGRARAQTTLAASPNAHARAQREPWSRECERIPHAIELLGGLDSADALDKTMGSDGQRALGWTVAAGSEAEIGQKQATTGSRRNPLRPYRSRCSKGHK